MADTVEPGPLRLFFTGLLAPPADEDGKVPTRRKDAAKRLDDANAALTAAQAEHAEHSADLRRVEREIADLRNAMATAPTPADIEGQLEELRTKVVDQRRLRAALLDADAERSAAGQEVKLATANLDEVDATLADAQRRLDEVRQIEGRLAGWDAMLGQPPLDTLEADAVAALDGESFGAAQARVEADIPDKLRARALERLSRQRELGGLASSARADAETLRDGTAGEEGGSAAVAAARWMVFRRALADFRDHVLLSRERLDLALAQLKAVVASPPLTEAQADHIRDSDVVAKGQAAAALEQARNEQAALVAAKRAEIEKRRLELRVEDIDANVEENSELADLRTELGELEDALATAKTALTEEERLNLDRWEAAVPDPIWGNLVAFEEARRTLESLRDADPAALRGALDDAAGALVEALKDEDEARRVRRLLERTVAARSARETFLRNAKPALRLSAARGDRNVAPALVPLVDDEAPPEPESEPEPEPEPVPEPDGDDQ